MKPLLLIEESLPSPSDDEKGEIVLRPASYVFPLRRKWEDEKHFVSGVRWTQRSHFVFLLNWSIIYAKHFKV